MDFHAGPVSVFITTLFVYVATLQLNLCIFKLYCSFVAKFLSCLQCLPLVKFVDKVYESRDISIVS